MTIVVARRPIFSKNLGDHTPSRRGSWIFSPSGENIAAKSNWRCTIATVVDLFAGCGGLSLGLEQAGFETVFVNELNPDAMKSYLMNRRGTGLSDPKNHAYDVTELTAGDELPTLARRLKRDHGEVSLVVGGPPCQGFSGIGHRRSFDLHKEEIPSNHLYGHMAKVVQGIAPKAFVFENVRGLLNSRWTKTGESGEIWADVQRTFRAITVRRRGGRLLQYRVEPALVFAKDYGVPQNRPRVLMVGIREDVRLPELKSRVANGFLPAGEGGAPDLEDLLGDLVDPDWRPGGATTAYPYDPKNEFQEQLRTENGRIALAGAALTEQEYSSHTAAMLEKFAYMIANDGEIPEAMRTKKFAQRVFPRQWGASGPSITATSLPDDYVHFEQPRTPTVREWARLQTFPDSYQFSGKRTTGGRRRAGDPSIGQWTRDVPKFTQIGNAVPVELGRRVGTHLRELLSE
jgi:DNA (cytosine-5)-methyltransferase 1